MGMIYKRGQIYWIKYYRNGKPYRESTRSKKEADAKKLLKKREGEISSGKLPGVYFDRVRFDELAEDFLRDYRVNNKKSLSRAERSVSVLRETFEGVRVPDITTPRINAYIERRMAERMENATMNRELAALKRMLMIGYRQTHRLKWIECHISPCLKRTTYARDSLSKRLSGGFERRPALLPERLCHFFLQGRMEKARDFKPSLGAN